MWSFESLDLAPPAINDSAPLRTAEYKMAGGPSERGAHWQLALLVSSSG